MDDISIDIKLGKVASHSGSLAFTLRVEQNMKGHLQLYAYDPSDLRKSGVLINLDAKGFSELKEIIEKTERTVKTKNVKSDERIEIRTI